MGNVTQLQTGSTSYTIKDTTAQPNITNAFRYNDYGNYAPQLYFYQEMVSGDDGSISPNPEQIRTQIFHVGKGSTINIVPSSGYYAHVRWYNTSEISSFVSSRNVVSGDVVAPADYLIIVLTTTSYGNISISEGSNLSATISSLNFPRNMARIYSMSESINEADYVNIDLVTGKIRFGSAPTGAGRVYLRTENRTYQIGGQELDFSAKMPFAFIFFNVRTETFSVIGADNTALSLVDAENLYIGSIWGLHPSVNMNIYPFYYVNGIKTYPTDTRGTFDSNRPYGYSDYCMAVLGDSVSTYDGISEDEIGGRAVWGPYYPAGDVNSSDKMWWAVLQKMLRFGGPINVSAISRSRYQDNIDSDGVYAPAVWNADRIARLHLNGVYPHYIFIDAGLNDGYSVNNYGEFSYTNDESTILAEPETIARGIELTLVRIMSQNPYTRIVLIMPHLISKNTTSFNWKSYYKTCELIEQIGKAYGVYKIVDLRKCGISEGLLSSYTIDGTHPNADGMKAIAAYIYNCITDDEQPIKLH